MVGSNQSIPDSTANIINSIGVSFLVNHINQSMCTDVVEEDTAKSSNNIVEPED